MFQKIILIISLFFLCGSGVFANQKVEDVFQDINADYKYIGELQALYDKGIIKPNIHNKFNPYELLTREEFVGILMETNCVQCTKPGTDFDLIQSFQDKSVYYDVNNDSNYFYCIKDADNKKFIQGYQSGTVCENGKSKTSEVPFCPYNTIILEEALAIVMRAGNILTQSQANSIIQEIKLGKSYPNIGSDIKTRNIDNSIYDFYPYFYEADRFIITEYNNLGEKIEYSLIEKKGDNYFPKKSINREDFLKIATFALKNSSCIDNSNENISGKINIFNQKCSVNSKQCEYEKNYITNEPIDLVGDVNTTCVLGFSDTSSYKWVIHNLSNNTESLQTGKYIDNLNFEKSGNYKIDLFVKDLCGNKSVITKYISVGGSQTDEFSASINKKYKENLEVIFSSFVQGNTGEYTYSWDFGDGNTSNKKNPSHKYTAVGIYDVTLKVTDKNGIERKIPATVNLYNSDFNVAIGIKNVVIGSTDFIQFEGLTNSNNPQLTYFWELGDGNTSNKQNPLHHYTKPGKYIITLVVTDENGNSKKVSAQIIIDDGNFGINISTKTNVTNNGLKVDFSPLIYSGTGPFSYSWSFGDGTTSTEQNPTHLYTKDGMYTVKLTVVDAQGKTRNSYTQIYVGSGGLSAEIEAIPSAHKPGEFTFTGIIEGGKGPFSYNWYFGDNTDSTEPTPIHIYTLNGTYPVTLVVTDSNGNKVLTQTILVVVTNKSNDFNINLVANPISGSGPLHSSFEVNIQGGTGPYIYKWDFADGVSGLGKTINHTFQEPGTYQVLVTVSDVNGLEKKETIIIQVGNINIDSNLDSDNDGVLDRNDKCPLVPGKIENDGCPIFDKVCSSDKDCPENSKCAINNNISTCIPISLKNNCEYNGNSTVFGNIICDTCPCQNVLDFNATLRKCDVVFPAITSLDGKEVFSKGNYYQIKK